MGEMVERVAKAMWIADGNRIDWEKSFEPRRNMFRAFARSALTEIKAVISEMADPDKHLMTLTEHNAWREVLERFDDPAESGAHPSKAHFP